MTINIQIQKGHQKYIKINYFLKVKSNNIGTDSAVVVTIKRNR